MYDFAIIAQL